MKVERLSIPDVMLIVPQRFTDPRGYFAETYSNKRYAAIGIDRHFVQDNQSLSRPKGTLRGLHCQIAPFAQGKLVALTPRFAELGFALRKIGRPHFDFDRLESIDTCFLDARPALVINAAGWTAVDAAETQPDAAGRANDIGPARLAAACAAIDIPYIHISTDYVFDGTKGRPYVETDEPNPINVYGATKLAGEEKILALGGRVVILRTSWVYSEGGKNFVRTMLAAAQKTNELHVVADQRGCPTSADDLASAIRGVVACITMGWHESYYGIFHVAGGGDATWHSFADAIFISASRFGWGVPAILPITTAEWSTAARRPADGRLECSMLEATFGVRMPEWRTSLEYGIRKILDKA